jgi:bifunctional DNA-binding transcriptional regulator/antitoxin component of YhaV-PrlF toxin-antitoxin module
MSTAHLRDRRQITLPVDVVAAAGLQPDDALNVRLVNGVIHLVPLRKGAAPSDMRRFLGAAHSCYGPDTNSMNQHLRDQRDAW